MIENRELIPAKSRKRIDGTAAWLMQLANDEGNEEDARRIKDQLDQLKVSDGGL